MKFFNHILTLAIALPLSFAAPANSKTSAKNIPNSYIIVFKNNITAATMTTQMSSITSLIARRTTKDSTPHTINSQFNMQSLKGFLLNTTSPSLISEILQDPNIAYIEPNTLFSISTLTTQRQSPYGLARISHRSANSNGNYIYDSSSGSGVTVYIIDTGIYTQHSEFETRAAFGANFVPGSPDTDENGHGTHCAGTVGGKSYGVAKAARLVGVKVLDRNGSGSNSAVIQGIQWVTQNAPRNSVISMSLGGGYSRATNSAVKSAVDAGITVVVAAGNDGEDAKNYSPASEADAVTVGATDSNDNRASFSNYGPVLDIFAPGVNILSAWIGGANSSKSISGTSMATPHIAGLSAYLISLEKLSTPSAVAARLKNLATKDVVRNAAGSLNLLAYNGNGA